MTNYTYNDVAKMIDHSLLKPILTKRELEEGCRIAVEYDVASVCILPYSLKLCAEILKGSTVVPSTTIGFPHGGNTSAIKQAESVQALKDGGLELDMVVNISAVLSGEWDYVRQDIAGVVNVAHEHGAKVKVIFENCYLNDEQKKKLCVICGELRADWVKTSTGYGTSGATIEDLKLMRANSPAHVQVKAAGGVRDLETLLAVRETGATRCGATATIAMMEAACVKLGLKPIRAVQAAPAPAGY